MNLLLFILLKFFCTRISCVGVHLAINKIFTELSPFSTFFQSNSENQSCEYIILNHFNLNNLSHSFTISSFVQYKYNLILWLQYLFFISSKKYGIKSVQLRFGRCFVGNLNQNQFAIIQYVCNAIQSGNKKSLFKRYFLYSFCSVVFFQL